MFHEATDVETGEMAQCGACKRSVALVYIGRDTRSRVLNFHLDGIGGACAGSYRPASAELP